MKKKTLKKLAKKAGFIFWGDESYRPDDMLLGIDWSSDYDDSLVELARLIEDQTYAKIDKK